MKHIADIGENDVVFALDIGTRSVIGVVGVSEQDVFRVLDVQVVEHTHRAVIDGQIENIEQTANIATLAKERIEERLGFKLSQVHIAAAGRVLKTKRVSHEIELPERVEIDAKQVFLLESRAIQCAYEQLMEEVAQQGEDISFYCVGHSVNEYTLDGYTFSTLLGHKGKKLSVELIATFLPSEVVESLYTTMQRIGLGVASVTLEPIAAINAVIPKELRLLNVALVDVGAGTSDIAITNKGSVRDYTMATVAGDEVTERIMEELLVDFQMAEQIKFSLADNTEMIEYTDILGMHSTVSASDITSRIEPTVDGIAKIIAEKILEINGSAPMAVFVVGGGSKTIGLCPLLAKHLGMDENKVAVGSNNYMKRLVKADPQFTSAEFATPIGIALSAGAPTDKEDYKLTLNGKPVRLYNSTATTVMELLLHNGYKYNQVMGRSGKGLTFDLNGEKQVVRGELPALAGILINGKVASITTPVAAGDDIVFIPAKSGRDVDNRIQALVENWSEFSVELDGEKQTIGTLAYINGQPVGADARVEQMDSVRVHNIKTLKDLLNFKGYLESPHQIMINGVVDVDENTELSEGEIIGILEE